MNARRWVTGDGRRFADRTDAERHAANVFNRRGVVVAVECDSDVWNVEVTDTFAGEANYAWCHRYVVATRKGARQSAIVRAAKAAAGWDSYFRTTTESDGGDGYIVRPRSPAYCVVMFISRGVQS